MSGTAESRSAWAWTVPAAVFAVVLVAQLWLVAAAGTDIPFQDQWDAEGRGLYPAWSGGTLRAADFFRAHNEHRIGWTKALDVALFKVNGQWDPLVQLTANALVRASAAALLAWLLARGASATGRVVTAAAVAVAFLPQLAWHNALWGFQSQVYFALLFSVLALASLGARAPSGRRQLAGLAAGIAAILAMGAGGLVPVALGGVVALRAVEERRFGRARWSEAWPALVLLAVAVALRAEVSEHAALGAHSAAEFFSALGRVLAWPHVDQPLAALALNLPLVLLVVTRAMRRRAAAAGEDFVLLLGGWAMANGVAAAWARGGGAELATGVPSRYVDFLVLLPLANAWAVFALVRNVGARERWRVAGRAVAGGWGLFLFVGWLGLSAQMMRGVILPRVRDRDAPVRLAVKFQATGDAAVFAGQPRLLVPHPDLDAVRAVLGDPRMAGRLPPSLQPDKPMGPLSRAARWVLGR